MAVTLTDKAAEQLKAIMKSEVEKKNLTAEAALRLMVVGGGCSGFSYKMGFDESIKEDDRAKEIKGVKVIVDEKSTLYLNGDLVRTVRQPMKPTWTESICAGRRSPCSTPHGYSWG